MEMEWTRVTSEPRCDRPVISLWLHYIRLANIYPASFLFDTILSGGIAVNLDRVPAPWSFSLPRCYAIKIEQRLSWEWGQEDISRSTMKVEWFKEVGLRLWSIGCLVDPALNRAGGSLFYYPSWLSPSQSVFFWEFWEMDYDMTILFVCLSTPIFIREVKYPDLPWHLHTSCLANVCPVRWIPFLLQSSSIPVTSKSVLLGFSNQSVLLHILYYYTLRLSSTYHYSTSLLFFDLCIIKWKS